MRILHIPEITAAPLPAAAPVPAAPAKPAPIEIIPVSSAEKEQLESLENVAKALMKKLEVVEARLEVLEAASVTVPVPASVPASASAAEVPLPAVVLEAVSAAEPAAPVLSPVSMDVEAVKKGLLTKMWKYMNDESAKAV